MGVRVRRLRMGALVVDEVLDTQIPSRTALELKMKKQRGGVVAGFQRQVHDSEV